MLCPGLRIRSQLPAPIENGRISNFEGLVVTLTLDQVILHTIVHHSSTCTYMLNFIEIKDFCGRTDGRTDVWMDILDRL